MAALYLHNAIFTPEPSESSTNPHSRHLSAVSTATLHTITSERSHPTEPLLKSVTSESLAYLDLLERQPAHPQDSREGRELELKFDSAPATKEERKARWERTIRKRLRKLRLVKQGLQLLIGLWAVYNTVRYFIAFTIYNTSPEGQAVSLALGTSTTLSLAFILASNLISLFQPYLLLQSLSIQKLVRTRAILHYLSSAFLIAPTIINLVFIFVWRNSRHAELNVRGRCYLDIDIIWSVSGSSCQNRFSSWGAWAGLSVGRFIFTFMVIVSYHVTYETYQHTRHPSWRRRKKARFSRSNIVQEVDRSFRPTQHQSQSSLGPSLESAPLQPEGQRVMMQYHHGRPVSSVSEGRKSSQSSLEETSRPGGDPSIRSFRSSRASSVRHSAAATSSSHLKRSSPNLGEVDEASSSSGHTHSAQDSFSQASHPHQRDADIGTDLVGFADRFRSLVNQISRETDEALEYARPDLATAEEEEFNPYRQYFPSSNADQYNPSRYNDLPGEHVRVLGNLIRRMPTIESLGSREAGSYYAPSRSSMSMSGGARMQSRPPTGANTIAHSLSDRSESPSRTGSLSAPLRAAVIACTNAGSNSNNLNNSISGSENTADFGDAANSSSSWHLALRAGSRSTVSYYTAVSSPSSPRTSGSTSADTGPELNFASAESLNGPSSSIQGNS